MPVCSICNGRGSFSKTVDGENIDCWLCKGTGREKKISKSYPHAVKRTATKKVSRCCQCGGQIEIGQQYYDTLERMDIWKTYKICLLCWDKGDQE